jgi:hypothetical protein
MKDKIYRSGYIYIHIPNHPNIKQSGYFAEHRYVVEQAIGRYLNKSEVVHHINHRKDDNRIENLALFGSAGMHTAKMHPAPRVNGKYGKIN